MKLQTSKRERSNQTSFQLREKAKVEAMKGAVVANLVREKAVAVVVEVEVAKVEVEAVVTKTVVTKAEVTKAEVTKAVATRARAKLRAVVTKKVTPEL